jgi:uncharacterized repeat protein (TIGR03803 family)
MNAPSLKTLAVGLGLCLAADNLMAQVTQTNLYSFGGLPDGEVPVAGLVQGSNGNFYGTTSAGGTSFNGGTIFQISPSGSYSNLYSFGSQPNDGSQPQARLVQGTDGNFYGTTTYGGISLGTVFRISPSGSYSNLYSLGSQPNDGRSPLAGLVQGTDGNFYGTTSAGGTSLNGTVFRISPSGSYSNLYSFGSQPNDGDEPVSGLVQGSDGNLYGTTYSGGTYGSGTVFRISTSGSHTNLYSFGSQPNDGNEPNVGLVEGSDGNFYGTTYFGGTNGSGAAFRISPSGSYSNLYSFGSLPNDGSKPVGGLVQGSDGNFYGATFNGGSNLNGTVFRISPSGRCSNLYSFASQPNYQDQGGLVQGSDGNFYGTTSQGGSNTFGTVFELVVPFNPPANKISALQIVSTNVLVTMPSVAAELCRLQYRTSLTTGIWSNVAGASATSIGGSLTMTNLGGFSPTQRFYRVAITP